MHGYVRARWALLLVMAAGLGGPGCGDGGAAQDDAASGAPGASNSAVGPGSGGSDAGGSGGDGVGGASAGGAAGQGGAGGSGASGGGANAGGAGTGGAGPVVCSDQSSPYATGVLAHQFGPGQDYGQDAFPYNVFGPPHDGGQNAGSLDVVSLGEGGSVVLSFTDNAIVDGPGPDFLVFENAFGYPSESPFDGGNLMRCWGTSSPEWSFLFWSSDTIKISCDMTRGSSGGPWLNGYDGNYGYLNGVNSRIDRIVGPTIMLSPYFDDSAVSLYNSTRFL